MADQLPPADELYAVRRQMDELKTRADALRTLLIGDKDSRIGNQYVAIVKNVTVNQPDYVEMRKAYPQAFEEHTHAVTRQQVDIRGLTEDGEIVRIKRGPTQ